MPITAGMYYFESVSNPTRPAVILIHGAGGNHLYWPPEMRRIKNQRIYSIDLPGHGKSDGIGRQSIADYGASILSFMDTLKIYKAVFVGHSMGGAIAQWLGLYHPKRTLGLGLIATAPQLYVPTELIENSSIAATLPIAIRTAVSLSFGIHTNPRLIEMATKRMGEAHYPVLHGDFIACTAFNESTQLGLINTPTLIIGGSEDKMIPLRQFEMMHNQIKNSMIHIINGAGHMVMLEAPQQVGTFFESFLNSMEYQPGKS